MFQLHPNGWTFAEGHVPKLELLPADSNAGPAGGYGRASNDQQPVTVSSLELRLPVVEKPGSLGGLVGAPAEKFLPEGYELAADFAALASPASEAGKRKLKRQGLEAGRRSSPARARSPPATTVKVVVDRQGQARPRRRRFKVAKGKLKKVAGGKTKKLKLKLTGRGRKALPRQTRS